MVARSSQLFRMSAVPHKSDIAGRDSDVRFVPIGDVRLPMRMPVAYQGFIPIE
jgi:hypothetical protein